jgi:hypothetical protein
MGSWRDLAYWRFMKFSVAPESRSVVVSALLLRECMCARIVIDFRADIYTLLLDLIKAVLIRRRENPRPQVESSERAYSFLPL